MKKDGNTGEALVFKQSSAKAGDKFEAAKVII